MIVDPAAWAELQARDPGAATYSLAYTWGRKQGLSHEDAVQSAQREAYGYVRSQHPLPESDYNNAWAKVPLFSRLPAVAPSAAEIMPEAYEQLRLPLESRINGRFASPTKVSNPEVVAAAFDPGIMNVPSSPLPSRDQLLLNLAGEAPPAPVVTPPAPVVAPPVRPVPPPAEPSPWRDRRRMAGQIAMGGGLGALAFLALTALSSPPPREPDQERT